MVAWKLKSTPLARNSLALLLAILVAGALLSMWMISRADHAMRDELLQQSRLVAQAIDIAQIKTLTGTATDLAKPDYQRIKEQLTSIRLANPQCRFLYLLGTKADGSVYIFVDSEPINSKDYSPPGQIYDEVPTGCRAAFDGKTEAVAGPYTDRWGVWVSGLVPLIDSKTGAVVAMLGMDINAHDWNWDVAARASLPVGLILVLLIVLATALLSVRRVDTSPKPILRRLLPPLAAMFILLLASEGAFLYHQHQQQLAQNIAADISNVSSDLRASIAQQISGLAATAQPIAADPDVSKALRLGNADHLLTTWRPVFETLHRENNLTHFYFFDKNRVCRLRIHKPEKYGDIIGRFTALEAERTGKTTSGLELGPLGTFTLRVVQPVFEAGKLVGYVELGKGIDDVLQNRPDHAGLELAVTIRKTCLDRQNWENGMRPSGQKADWDHLSRNVVAYASQGRLPDAFASWADCSASDHADNETDREIACNGKDWRVAKTPLQDVSGKEVGDLLIMRDTSPEKAAFTRLMVMSGMIGAVLLTLLLGSIYVLLRRTDAGIYAQQAALRQSERSYRNQFADNRSIMLLINPTDGQIIDANSAALRFYGHSRERLLAMRMTEINTLPAAEVIKALASVTAKHGEQFEFQHRLADGAVRDVEVSTSLIQFGERYLLHSIIHDITERKQAENSLRTEQENLKAIFTSSPVGMLLLNEETVIVGSNAVIAQMVSRTSDQINHQRSGGGLGCIHSFDTEEGCGFGNACPECPLRKGIQGVLSDGISVRGAEIQATLLINGQERHPWLRVSAEPVLLNGRKHVVVAIDDITDKKLNEIELRKLSAVVEQTPASVVIINLAGIIEYVNPAFTKTTGYTPQEAIGQTPKDLESGPMPSGTYANMWRELSAGREWRGELQNRRKNGELYWELAVISPIKDALGKITHYLAIKEDITARKVMEDELRSAARTDKLTGLPNRALFCDRLQQAVLRSQRLKDYHFAVLFLDFDRFKTINDSLGHDIGDLLLQEIANRLRSAVRSGDSLSRQAREHITARLGGDEFVVLLDGIASPQDATLVANRLLEAFAQPYRLSDHEVYSTASIGIVTSAIVANSADDVLRDADTAMYEAKLAGKGQYVVFDVSMRQRVQNRLNIENDLRKALYTEQLFLMYQPIISLQTGRIESFEALVRWEHPERGPIPPSEFIPIAEDTGLIIPIGEWVLREACGQFAQWRKSMGSSAPRSISVNLSRNQLVQPDLPQTIRCILEQTGMTPGCLHLEVTESAVMKDAAAATKMLYLIKDIGVKLDMDDFGTGYSSLACLHQFPIDVLKIDRSFIVNINQGRDFTAMVHAVTQLARNLNIQVIAEGIETEDQAMILQSLNCEFGQGYLFSKPLTARQVTQFSTPSRLLPGQTTSEPILINA